MFLPSLYAGTTMDRDGSDTRPFCQAGVPAAKQKIGPWVLANGTGDKLICGTSQVYGGQCSFKFKGSANEKSTSWRK